MTKIGTDGHLTPIIIQYTARAVRFSELICDNIFIKARIHNRVQLLQGLQSRANFLPVCQSVCISVFMRL